MSPKGNRKRKTPDQPCASLSESEKRNENPLAHWGVQSLQIIDPGRPASKLYGKSQASAEFEDDDKFFLRPKEVLAVLLVAMKHELPNDWLRLFITAVCGQRPSDVIKLYNCDILLPKFLEGYKFPEGDFLQGYISFGNQKVDGNAQGGGSRHGVNLGPVTTKILMLFQHKGFNWCPSTVGCDYEPHRAKLLLKPKWGHVFGGRKVDAYQKSFQKLRKTLHDLHGAKLRKHRDINKVPLKFVSTGAVGDTVSRKSLRMQGPIASMSRTAGVDRRPDVTLPAKKYLKKNKPAEKTQTLTLTALGRRSLIEFFDKDPRTSKATSCAIVDHKCEVASHKGTGSHKHYINAEGGVAPAAVKEAMTRWEQALELDVILDIFMKAANLPVEQSRTSRSTSKKKKCMAIQ